MGPGPLGVAQSNGSDATFWWDQSLRSGSSPVVGAGGGWSYSGVSFIFNEPNKVLLCNQAHILPVLLSEVGTVSVEVPKKHHILFTYTRTQQHSWLDYDMLIDWTLYLCYFKSILQLWLPLTFSNMSFYLSFPHLFHNLQDIIQCIKLLSGVDWSGVLRYEDKILYSWTYRWGGREEGCRCLYA